MIISAANLNLFFTQLETRFSMAFGAAPVWHEQVATIYPVTTEAWVSGWMGMLDKLRVWKGARLVRTPAPQTYSAAVLPFELTEGIDKFKLMNDQYGLYFPVVAHMGEQSSKWPDYSVRDLVEGLGDFAGAAQIGTDGVTHWNGAHPVDYWDASKGTYPNDYGPAGLTIGGQTVGGLFGVNSWATVWEDHASRKNESGEKIGVVPDQTMVPTQLHFPARTVLQGALFAPPVLGSLGTGAVGTANAPFVGAMDNPLRGSTDLMMNPDLVDPAAWYMHVTKKVIKPYGWALRQAATVTTRQDPTDPVVFDTHTFLFGVEGQGVPVWSLPWLSSRSGK